MDPGSLYPMELGGFAGAWNWPDRLFATRRDCGGLAAGVVFAVVCRAMGAPPFFQKFIIME
jgi:hypothetical protein